MKKCFVGIDLGGTKVAMVLAHENGEIFAKEKFPTDKGLGGEELVQKIAESVIELLKKHDRTHKDALGIGMGAPSFMDFENGYVTHSANIPNLTDIPVRKLMSKYFDCPIFIDNDANVAALAEHKRGAGRGYNDMIYLTASTGIGGGIILCNEVYRGNYSMAGEFGHMVVTPGAGVSCGCGNNGCFESYISGAHIFQHVQERVDGGQSTLMTDYVEKISDISGEHLLKALDAGDEMAQEIFEQICYYFGFLVYNLYMGLNINCFVIGGGLTNFGERLFTGIRASFESFRKKDKHLEVNILPAAAGQDFGVIGAVELIAQNV